MGLLAAVAALGLLQACSAVKLAYNNVPELAYWWIDGYADLNEAQSIKVREELARLHQWHRANELPKVAELLQKTQQLATADVTAEQACGLFADVRLRFDAILARAEPATADIASGLGPAQIAHIEAKFDKINAEWREEWTAGTPAERQGRRLKSAVERAEQFYGSLEERQLAVLRNAIARSDFDPQLSFAERLRRQQDMLQTLRRASGLIGGARLNATQASAALRGYLERSLNSPNPVYRAYSEKSIQDSCRTIAQLHNSTTPEQRERAARRLNAYQRDALELAAQR